MNPFLPFRSWGRNPNRSDRKSRANSTKRRPPRRGRLESLEDRRLLTWQGVYSPTTGLLTISGEGLSSDTGVLKVDPVTGDILLDGNNSGKFGDTGANLATLTGPIQINANTTVNSNFVIDNGAGAFFEAPSNAFFPPGTPLFNYTGSSALNPNTSLTIRGVQGIADTFEVALDPTSNGGSKNINGISTGEAGTVVLSEPPNALNQQNKLIVTFGANPATNNAGVTGHLSLDGADPQGNDQLFIDDQGATISPIQAGLPTGGAASDWTLNGNTIKGPQFPPSPTQVPPVPPFAPGTVGDITYSNIANLQFNDNVGGDLLTINSVATNTTASTAVANYTVVNYNQPLAFPVNLVGIQNAPAGILDVVGAANGNNSLYVNANSVALAAAGTKPQYNTPFTHVGADLNYTEGSLATMNVAANGGNNNVTIQVPPTLIAPYTSDTLPASFSVYGGALPPPPVLPGAKPIAVAPGTTLLRVFGNAPGPLSAGADSISVSDLAAAGGGGTKGAANIQMSGIAGVVLYGEGGNDTLTNNSMGSVATGQPAVPALFIPGNGNSTLTGGGGSDMFLGGDGQYTIVSKAVSTPAKPTTTYFFPHQDQFGNIYDPLLNPAYGNTTSMLTGTGGNQVVVTGAVDPSLSVAYDPTTQSTVGDLDTGNLANPGLAGGGAGGGGNTNGGQTVSYPTVPASNVTAPDYMVTDALSALEGAMGIAKGQFPANTAAMLEFGGNMNLRTQFAAPKAFVGRAYNDFLTDRAGAGGTFGASSGSTLTSGPEGGSVVGQNEIDYWTGLLESGQVNVPEMQAHILASPELQQMLPNGSSWLQTLYQDVFGFGASATDQQVRNANAIFAAAGNTPAAITAARYAIALQLLNSTEGQAAEIRDAYANVVPGASASSGPSPTDLAAIQADLAAGETLPQVAKVMGESGGDYLNYELANNVGTVGFVANVYQKVLGRPASSADLNFWAAASGAGVSEAAIALTVLNSAEAKMHVVINTYQHYLGRSPDTASLNYWTSLLTSGMSDEQFVSLVVASPEYYANHGSTSPGYINGLYQDILRRTTPPSQQDIGYWVTQMAAANRGAGQARADVAIGFLYNPEYENLIVYDWYGAFYGRAPSPAELQTAESLLRSGATDEQAQAQILASHAATS